VLACAGISALTTLSNLTRLGLQGNGFGIAELAVKVTSFLQNSLHCDLRIDKLTACRGSVAHRAQAALGHLIPQQVGAAAYAHTGALRQEL
jgi:hypothetical protein